MVHLSVCAWRRVVSGCGGGSSSGSPAAPSTTASSVALTLRDVVLVGTNSPATATATLSNGQTQSVTTGWRSDTPAVAMVTDACSVTGVSNGRATIAVTFGGRDGTKTIRVAPNYDGRWQGMQVITSQRRRDAAVSGAAREVRPQPNPSDAPSLIVKLLIS